MMHFLLIIVSLATVISAASRTSAPSGCIIVGFQETFSTIQSAVDFLSNSSSPAQCIFIHPGTYLEQVYIPPLNGQLTIYGSTTDTSSYTSNAVKITHSSSLASGATDDDATVRNHAAGTKFYNIDIQNSYGVGSQALALSAEGDQQGYYGVGLYGYQDTLLSEIGNQVYAKCFIAGAIDFIFGQHATTWIDSSDIQVTAPGGAITASGRSSDADVSYYVINKSTVSAAPGAPVGSQSVYLGRPWRDYARVCFQDTALSSIIAPAGWEVWNSSSPNTAHVTFQEYGNSGSGAAGMRANFSSKLSSPVLIETVLGPSYASWVDESYLA